MKKVLSVLLAALMAASMVACGGDDAAETTADAATTTKAPAAQTTVAPSGDDEVEEPDDEPEEVTLMADDYEWHYMLFNCPYVGAEGGSFTPETDEMAAYLADHPEWYTETETMAAWPTAQAPFGDRQLGGPEGSSPIGWAGDVHGIMLYTTFELSAENYELVKNAEPGEVYMNMFYDNAIYMYINGTLVFSHDANCGAGDWNESQSFVDFSGDFENINEVLKEGTNEIAVSLKDCWGGREFIMGLTYLPLS